MSDARIRRRRALSELLRQRELARQEELVDALKALGHDVTQATVSRDLDQLGAVRIRQGGLTRYALPEGGPSPRNGLERFRGIFGEWVREVVPAGSLVVLKTPPGSAHLVGVALDAANLADVAGTISGDDTLFVATASTDCAARLAESWKEWLQSH